MTCYNYNDMLEYVEKTLVENNGIKSKNPILSFRNRFSHIKRVYGWAKRLVTEYEEINKDAVLVASIFHDVGYGEWGKELHPFISAKIFKEYAVKNNFDENFIDIVYYLILNHSHKELLGTDISLELTILMEADLLDEEGSLGLVFDLLAEGAKHPGSYNSVLDEIMIHSAHILDQDFMVTELGKKYWNEKKDIIKTFLDSLKFDLFLE